jgi:putative endonuclease
MLTAREKGTEIEQAVARHLKQQGLKLIEHSYQCRLGEIDLIMQDKQTLVFVEVRYRKQTRFGSALESITYQKQQKLIRTASHYLQTQGLTDVDCRFDAVGVSHNDNQLVINWVQHAFEQS